MHKLILLFILFIISSTNCFPTDFFNSSKWMSALYYEKNGASYKSLAEHPDFFVTKAGKTNPRIEYEASLKLVLNQDIQFKTKFPYRYKLISKQHNLPYAPSVTIDPSVTNVVIAYPNRYMSNPASMFGHLFLVLKTNRGMIDSDILHYVAETDGNRGFGYIVNGVSGQYKGYFFREPYYKKIKHYNYVEDRDIIYYDLTLSEDQIENLQLHHIELKNTFFYYYFLDKNCAFFIGKLLNVVIDSKIHMKKPYMMPSHVVNDLIKANLLTSKRKRIANTKIFNHLFNNLNKSQQEQVIDLYHKKTTPIHADKDTLRAFIISSEYMISNHSDLANVIRFNRINAYKQLHQLKQSNVRPDKKKEPVTKIKSNMIGLSHEWQDSYQLSYSPIYFSEHDQFDKLDIVNVKALGFKIKSYKNSSPKYTLDILELNNIRQYNIVLNSFSWNIKSSIAHKRFFLINQEANIGIAWNVMNRGLFYNLIGFNYANFNNISDSRLPRAKLMPSIDIGLTNNLTESLKLLLAYKHKFKKNYIITELIYKHNNTLNKLTLINDKHNPIIKLSVEHLF